MRLRIILVGVLIATVNLFGQAAPVVGAVDPTPLFKDKDKTLNKNKQAAMHIVIDLLAYGHWNDESVLNSQAKNCLKNRSDITRRT